MGTRKKIWRCSYQTLPILPSEENEAYQPICWKQNSFYIKKMYYNHDSNSCDSIQKEYSNNNSCAHSQNHYHSKTTQLQDSITTLADLVYSYVTEHRNMIRKWNNAKELRIIIDNIPSYYLLTVLIKVNYYSYIYWLYTIYMYYYHSNTTQ